MIFLNNKERTMFPPISPVGKLSYQRVLFPDEDLAPSPTSSFVPSLLHETIEAKHDWPQNRWTFFGGQDLPSELITLFLLKAGPTTPCAIVEKLNAYSFLSNGKEENQILLGQFDPTKKQLQTELKEMKDHSLCVDLTVLSKTFLFLVEKDPFTLAQKIQRIVAPCGLISEEELFRLDVDPLDLEDYQKLLKFAQGYKVPLYLLSPETFTNCKNIETFLQKLVKPHTEKILKPILSSLTQRTEKKLNFSVSLKSLTVSLLTMSSPSSLPSSGLILTDSNSPLSYLKQDPHSSIRYIHEFPLSTDILAELFNSAEKKQDFEEDIERKKMKTEREEKNISPLNAIPV